MSNEITNQIDYYIQQTESILAQIRQFQVRFIAPRTEVRKDVASEVVGWVGEAIFESPLAGKWGKKLTKGILTQQQKEQLAQEEQKLEKALADLINNLTSFFSMVSIKKPKLKPEGNSYLLLKRLTKVQETIRLETRTKKLIAILKAIRCEPLIYNRDIPQLLAQEKVLIKPSMERKIKRGTESLGFIYFVFSLLVGIIIFFISIPPIDWIYKIVIFLFSLIILIWSCFFNAWFQKNIIKWKNKLEN